MLKFNNQGISLLEVVITIAVILTGILVLTNIFPIAFKVSSAAEQATVATNLAQAKIEQMFYLDYENIPLGTVEAKARLSTDPANPFYHYQRETIVTYVDGNLNNSATETGIKKITVNCYWENSLFTTEKSVQLIILISEK